MGDPASSVHLSAPASSVSGSSSSRQLRAPLVTTATSIPHASDITARQDRSISPGRTGSTALPLQQPPSYATAVSQGSGLRTFPSMNSPGTMSFRKPTHAGAAPEADADGGDTVSMHSEDEQNSPTRPSPGAFGLAFLDPRGGGGGGGGGRLPPPVLKNDANSDNPHRHNISVSPRRPSLAVRNSASSVVSKETIRSHIEDVLSGKVGADSPIPRGAPLLVQSPQSNPPYPLSPAYGGTPLADTTADPLLFEHPGVQSFWVRSSQNAAVLAKKTSVSFYGSRVGDVVAYAARDILRTVGCTVETLDLGCTDMTNRGATVLGDALSMTTASTVTMVKLNGNNLIGDEGVAALMKRLQPSVRILELGDCALTAVGAEAVATQLARLPLLRELYLFCNPDIGDAGAAHFAKAVGKGHSFDLLDMQGCNVSSDARSWLRAAGIRALH